MEHVWILERSVTNIDRLAEAPLITRLGVFKTQAGARERLGEWASSHMPERHEKLIADFRIVHELLEA